MGGDGAFDVGDGGEGVARKGSVVVDDEIEAVVGDDAVAVGAWHIGVDDGDEGFGGLDGGEGGVYGDAEADESVFIGRADLDKGGVEREDVFAEEAGDFGEEDGDVVGASGGDSGAEVGANEEALGAERAFGAGLGVGGRAFGVEVEDFDVFEFGFPVGEGAEEGLGRGGHAVHIDALPRGDLGDSSLSRDDGGHVQRLLRGP